MWKKWSKRAGAESTDPEGMHAFDSVTIACRAVEWCSSFWISSESRSKFWWPGIFSWNTWFPMRFAAGARRMGSGAPFTGLCESVEPLKHSERFLVILRCSGGLRRSKSVDSCLHPRTGSSDRFGNGIKISDLLGTKPTGAADGAKRRLPVYYTTASSSFSRNLLSSEMQVQRKYWK